MAFPPALAGGLAGAIPRDRGGQATRRVSPQKRSMPCCSRYLLHVIIAKVVEAHVVVAVVWAVGDATVQSVQDASVFLLAAAVSWRRSRLWRCSRGFTDCLGKPIWGRCRGSGGFKVSKVKTGMFQSFKSENWEVSKFQTGDWFQTEKYPFQNFKLTTPFLPYPLQKGAPMLGLVPLLALSLVCLLRVRAFRKAPRRS